ncbi:ribosomal maturation YjgA family protein [Psychroflexus salis]|uniref:DUF2809 domain-containing protein n=1 Tax=Psychroflexus salis TaxID=1526574 RepID=A0A917E6R9_9FLAO|nr:DUF2809 domain-containing protein [Psychroflexus salis]GGE08805.1 hypothetical protein GCM10010831_07980 [Psychroflexus salis]
MIKQKHVLASIFYAFFMFISLGLGLASRNFEIGIPKEFNLYLGDAIWAMMVYFGFRCISPKYRILNSAILTLAFSYAIEISQLYQAEWLNDIRKTLLGGLILGFGFLWSDILAYSIGVAFGFGFDYLWCYFSNKFHSV